MILDYCKLSNCVLPASLGNSIGRLTKREQLCSLTAKTASLVNVFLCRASIICPSITRAAVAYSKEGTINLSRRKMKKNLVKLSSSLKHTSGLEGKSVLLVPLAVERHCQANKWTKSLQTSKHWVGLHCAQSELLGWACWTAAQKKTNQRNRAVQRKERKTAANMRMRQLATARWPLRCHYRIRMQCKIFSSHVTSHKDML